MAAKTTSAFWQRAPQDTRIIVGLSGGVDSSVTALRLVEAGYQVEGLFMFNWSEDEAGRCQAADDFDDAAAVCEVLDIPLHRADFSREYKARVFRYFLDSYAAGRTPNPDVLCNREIKFDAFLHHAERLGADAIATGHYARLVHDESGTRLLRGADPGKDQSYFLSAVPMAALERTLFPLGDTYKADVRAIARDAGLPIHDKPDSTGVCFIGERDFEGFLRQYLSGKAGPVRVSGGPLDGKTIAEHAGLIYYTIGQRRGLGLGGVKGASQAPWFVAAKDLNTDTLWVTQDHDHPELARMSLTTSTPHWLIEPPQLPRRCTAQVRYRQRAIDCRIDPGPDGGLTVHFDRPPRAIAPGQYAVFYDGDHCLGSAEIVAAGHSELEIPASA
ncbi:tRNA-specific 2-thiouridylase MnmA protein [Salinisphaera shabanensis E1L3A]|uniref:tRNA-specific 2-thiouridylase MnmA n=1 Tax=Salinisphaera shabanensis E1L3A TaxID=1033802 RepID=U2FPP6_9GAMM|nr:tRNA 2-thiouridine(34) synthase MnmA [Salinisphaera shabanensis]ERJ18124.1 tRNA-specific 2-thiouridylase MnmA protein [Salinisphaera shabanensis E1L3A]